MLNSQEENLNEIKHFHYMTTIAMPSHNIPYLKGHELIIIVELSIVIISIYLDFFIYTWN